MRIDEANEEMQLNLTEGDYETVAGFILSHMRRIPKTNELIRYKDLKIVIKEMQGVKIERILITRESHATS
jgi:putative hemolysin